MQGNELTVSIAFTVRLFLFVPISKTDRMRPGDCPIQHGQASSQYSPNVDRPNFAGKQSSGCMFLLNILPFQTKVALDRIATYLDEDEVDEQVSSLKRSHFGASAGDDDTTKGLGIENGTFKWNEVEQKDDDTAKTAENIASTPTDDAAQGANDETERGSITASEASNHRFELRDVNIVFPERQLTVITGPTASGKTALLVSLRESPHQKSCITHMDVARWLC
jgi:ABC-type multidrug transport system fused ATPase/permease subunit